MALFDFDGVIVNSEIKKAQVWGKHLQEYGVPNGGAWYKSRIGRLRIVLCREAIELFKLPVTPETFEAQHIERSRASTESELPPIPSMIDLVKRLAVANTTLGIASSQHVRVMDRQLQMIGIKDLFSTIVSGEDNGLPGKPDPAIYLLAAKRLGVPENACVGIEDTEVGVAAVKAAGMACIGFQNPESGNQDLSQADMVVNETVLPGIYAHHITELVRS